MKLLCISNGHGEDVVAGRILQAIRQHPAAPEIFALPMVGAGQTYQSLDIPLVGPTKTMPSGGFIYMDSRQLARDLKSGLLSLILAQFRTVRAWARSGGWVLAVGDVAPLLLAWLSGASYGFVGTAKSDYSLRDETGPLGQLSSWEQLQSRAASIYYPWERWLMARRRCKVVFLRDQLTTERLQRWPIPAIYAGNPMMDGLEPSAIGLQLPIAASSADEEPLTVVLLPGSRQPEAYANWEQMLAAVSGLIQTFRQRQLLLLAAIAPGLDLDSLQKPLKNQGWLPQAQAPAELMAANSATARNQPPLNYPIFTDRNATLALIQDQGAYADCLHQAHFAIAMAGTATEQFVGLGKPAITLPGKGPQFNPAFAKVQARHLGLSVIPAQRPADVAAAIKSLLTDPDRLQLIQENGRNRMGMPGAARRIAKILIERL